MDASAPVAAHGAESSNVQAIYKQNTGTGASCYDILAKMMLEGVGCPL